MSELALRAEGLGKCYRLTRSVPEARYQTLQDQFHYRTLREDLALALGRLRGRAGRAHSLTWALREVGFEVGAGEAVGLIGRNGAGKSTLLKILARITEPSDGHVELWGRVGALLEVGTGFHPELTGRENVYLSGAIHGLTRAELRRRFDEIVSFAELEPFLELPVKRYSSGMYMRLAFAVAAHLEPELLLVDEVLAVGDAAFQRKCLSRMEAAGRQGRTVVFVSHDLAAVARLCPRTILLHDGRVLRDGPTPEVTRSYLEAGAGTTVERVWRDDASAPGEELVRLRAVRVRDGLGRPADTIDVRQPVQLEVEYLNQANDRAPVVMVQLFNDAGICLFAASDSTNAEWRATSRRFEGRVISRCTIPANLLAEGTHRVTVELTTSNPDRTLACERDAVAFMMVDGSQGDGARGTTGGVFPGVMRPLLPWQVELPDPEGSSRIL